MGCDSYAIPRYLDSGRWGEILVRISENDDDLPCLCTFPRDYVDDGGFGPDIVRSLAYLGAMVVLAHHNTGLDNEEYQYLPGDVPDWIRHRIDAEVKGGTDEE